VQIPIQYSISTNNKLILPISFNEDAKFGDIPTKNSVNGTYVNITAPADQSGSQITFLNKTPTENETNLYSSKRYYAVLNSNENATLTITVKNNQQTTDGTKTTDNNLNNFIITLYPILTCSYAFDKNLINEGILLENIHHWDVEDIFDYTYQPNKNIQIDNPLLGNSYFNENNMYNRYAIPYIKNINTKVVNIK
jgi:hypothetical protein